MSIYITQLIYIKPGEEETFNQFESIALPAIAKYNGSLLLRVRPVGGQVIAESIDTPYEIHLVSFPSDEDFQQFMTDEGRKESLHLKEQSVRSVWLIKGNKL